jgi:prophage antirepressor-like protein
MSKQTEIKIFDDKQVRTIWDSEQEKWFIAIVDVIALLTESPNP